MLNGEGNEKGEEKKNNNKKTIGLISKKSNFARAAHFFCTFFCRCFAPLKRETSRNFLVTRFMEEMSYVFLFTFFFIVAHFHPASISHFLTAATKWHVVPPTKNVFLVFSISLQLFFSLSFAGLSPYFLFFSVFLFLYFPDLWT